MGGQQQAAEAYRIYSQDPLSLISEIRDETPGEGIALSGRGIAWES